MTIGKVQLAAVARDTVPSLTGEQAVAIAEAQLKVIKKAESHDLRHARWLRKQIGKQLGAAGHTIHELRGEIALLRAQKASMVHSAIDELIRGAVVEAVPIKFNEDGTIAGITSDVVASVNDGELAPIGVAELGEAQTS